MLYRNWKLIPGIRSLTGLKNRIRILLSSLLRLVNQIKDSELSLQAKPLWKERKFLSIVSGKLMRYRIHPGVKQWQLILPTRYHDVALEYVHN